MDCDQTLAEYDNELFKLLAQELFPKLKAKIREQFLIQTILIHSYHQIMLINSFQLQYNFKALFYLTNLNLSSGRNDLNFYQDIYSFVLFFFKSLYYRNLIPFNSLLFGYLISFNQGNLNHRYFQSELYLMTMTVFIFFLLCYYFS